MHSHKHPAAVHLNKSCFLTASTKFEKQVELKDHLLNPWKLESKLFYCNLAWTYIHYLQDLKTFCLLLAQIHNSNYDHSYYFTSQSLTGTCLIILECDHLAWLTSYPQINYILNYEKSSSVPQVKLQVTKEKHCGYPGLLLYLHWAYSRLSTNECGRTVIICWKFYIL